MELNKDISFIYEKILKKAHYDKRKQKYVISKEDYVPLNLSKKQLNLLREMCKRSGIELENHLYKLPSVEDEELFKVYNDLKTRLKLEPNNKELEERKVAVRNKIVTANLELIKVLIDRNLDEIQNVPNKAEIYQLGYSILLDYVEKIDIIYPKVFTKYISSNLMSDIRANMRFLDKGLSKTADKDLKKILKARNAVSSCELHSQNMELDEKSKFNPKRVEELLNLEGLLNSISIDEAIDIINDNDEQDNNPLYDTSFEKQLLLSTIRELIIKIIYTLPERQRDVIMLSYGFKDGNYYNDIEISKMLNVSHTRIGDLKQDALENLRLSVRSKYLKEIYDIEETTIDESITKKQGYVMEEILLDYIPKEEMNEYLEHITLVERSILELYHGFETGKKLNLREISPIIGFSPSKVHAIKKQAYARIRRQILKRQFKEQWKEITDEEYLDFLMKTYVIHQKPRHK